MASVFKEAAKQEIADQPFYLRYKGSILIVLSGLAWVLAELATSEDIAELGWGGAIGAAATLAAFLLNRFTKDGITPSMAERLERSGQLAFLDRPSASHVAAYEPIEVELTTPAEHVEGAKASEQLLSDVEDAASNASTAHSAAQKADDADATPPELPIYYGDSTQD